MTSKDKKEPKDDLAKDLESLVDQGDFHEISIRKKKKDKKANVGVALSVVTKYLNKS
jgi:hypothetical protein